MVLFEKICKDVLSRLLTVGGIVERRQVKPILANVLIEKKSDRIFFTSTDGDIQLETSIEDPNEGSFAFTVNAKKIIDILRLFSDEDKVKFIFFEEKQKIELLIGTAKFQLLTLPADLFPKITYVESDKTVLCKLPQKILKKQLSLVQYAMAHQDVRYYLNGLLLELNEHSFITVATDAHRLSYACTEVTECYPHTHVTLSRKVVLELYRLINDTNDELEVFFNSSRIAIQLKNVLLTTKLVESKFPDYKKVLQVASPKNILLDRIYFYKLLQRVSILSNDKLRGVVLLITNGFIKLSAANADQEESFEEMQIDYQGDEVRLVFNVDYILDVLTALTEEPIVKMSFSSPNHSVLLSIPDSDQFKYVLMPIKI